MDMLDMVNTVNTDLPVANERQHPQVEKRAIPFHGQRMIHQLIEAQALRVPHNVALASPHTYVRFTYQEMNERANQLAHALRRKGVGPEVPVCVCIERSPELIIALLAIMKAGGTYIPLDPSYPAARLTNMIQEIQPPVLLTQQHLLSLFSTGGRDKSDAINQAPTKFGEGTEVLCIDNAKELFASESKLNLENRTRAEHLAYVIYTSGSTGQPKGVQISHRNLLNLVSWKQQRFEQTARDRESCLAGVSFDAAQWEIWPSLISGGSIYLPEDEVRLSAELLQAWLLEQQITICTAPTQMAEGLLKLSWPAQGTLRYLLTGGDRLHYFAPVDLPFTLVNNYGPTENTIVSTSGVVPTVRADLSMQIPTIGTAITNVQTYILDKSYRPVPVGQEGELYLGGEGLSRGYFRQPAWTAERFVPHPFGTQPGALLYHTGDVCRYREDGQIEFVGRSDHQVKIRGFRVELGDIETALSQHPAVQEAVVIAYTRSESNLCLVAYLIVKEEISNAELRTFLSNLLPEYMIPTAFTFLDALPLTQSGKVDRKALPEPVFQDTEDADGLVLPRTETERMLLEICQEQLHLEQMSIYDNVFMLGAYSLLATQIMSRICATFRIKLPLVSIFQAPTVAQLAELVEQAAQNAEAEEVPMIMPVGRDTLIPLSFSQERVWFMSHLDPSNTSYHFQATLRFKGDLQVNAVEWALNEILRRHEIFRTTVKEVDEQPYQLIHEFTPFSLPQVDLRHYPAEQRDEQFQQLIQQESRRLFDLTCLPLVRWMLVRLEDQHYGLIHVEHHLVHDGWSLNVFLREFLALYRAFVNGEKSPLPELTIQFADFVAWHRQWMQSGVREQQLNYWREKLRGVPTLLKLPTDYPRPSMQRFKGAAARLELPGQLYNDLRAVGNREGVTLYTVMLTAFSILMARYADQNDFCLGSAIANRRWKETEGIMGMLVNNIVLRIQLGADLTLRDLLHQLHTLAMEAYENQDVPFDKMVEVSRVERDLSHNPLFQVMFSFHDSTAPQLELPGLELELLDGINNGSAKFDMNVTAAPRFKLVDGQKEPSAITLVWEYNTDLFKTETIGRMVAHFQLLLQRMIANLDLRLSQLSLLTPAEHEKIVGQWNDTATPYPARCIHQLIQEQALRHPQHTALVFEGQELSYGELERRSNQLARTLQQRGVGPDVLVGVCMERSLELVVALVGILKAGGAYVPLDPGYPKDRLAYMLEDSRVHVLITQQHLLKLLPEHSTQVICLDQTGSTLAHVSAEPVVSSVIPANLAYMIYTSGSTGRPKGAMNTHQGLGNRLLWMQEAYQLNGTDRVLQKTPISFDVSVWEFFWPLITGATLVLARSGGHQDSEYLARLISEQRITTLHFVPSMLAVFLQEPLAAQCRSLKRVICSGEALPYALQQEFFERLSANLYNLYGPTEAAIDVTYWSCLRNSPYEFVPIGYPIDNIQIYLLDRHLHPVPIGVAGELYIGGIGLARGYYQRPELTAERFIPHPFASNGERLYKTGDLARYLPDGAIEYLGRIDNQIKLRGFRIELGEIEAVLSKHPAVQENVVTLWEDEAGEKRLVAYIVAQQDQSLAVADLRCYLHERLPEYMVPAFFMQLDVLPLTPNGKVDRRALPAPAGQRSEVEVQLVKPSSPIECVLADMWRQILGVEQIGIHDNFFRLGGHSLLATRILSRMRRTFQVDITLRSFFDTPTIAGLAAVLEQQSVGTRFIASVGDVSPTSGPASELEEIGDLNHRNYQDLLGVLDELSDDEVEHLLGELSDESMVS
ncbi:MAG TPA: amino acid adenylation domain-containing protein [Ktedonosporobacter sp.]|nr:amino acid adenylation domain-containing protein [Ktedonosporobacter sp.]